MTEIAVQGEKKPRKNLLKNKKVVVTLFVVVVLLGAFVFWTKYSNLRKENARLSNPQESAKQEADRLKAEVGKLIELPNESPTVATVVDVNKLKEQAFFVNAQNGDRVLLFAQAKKAVLYRPSTGKIIEVAPINIGSGSTAGTSTEKNR